MNKIQITNDEIANDRHQVARGDRVGDESNSTAQHGAAEEWDDRCVGWKGLWARLLPFVVLVVLLLYVLFYVIWIHRESLSLDEALKIALVLPGALVVFDLPQVRGAFAKSPNTATPAEQKLAGWIRRAAVANVISILIHISLPDGDAKHAIGALSALSLLAILISIGIGQRVALLIEEAERRRQSDPLPLPPKAPTHGWVYDVLVWCALAFLAIVATAMLSLVVGVENDGTRSLIWCTTTMGFYFVYCIVGVSYRDGTIGHQKAGCRVVRQTTGDRVGLARSALRALMLIGPVHCLLAYSSVASLEGAPNNPGFLFQLLELSAVVSMLVLISAGALGHIVLRDVHPRGQGVVDLCTGTLSVATKSADADEETQPLGSVARQRVARTVQSSNSTVG